MFTPTDLWRNMELHSSSGRFCVLLRGFTVVVMRDGQVLRFLLLVQKWNCSLNIFKTLQYIQHWHK